MKIFLHNTILLFTALFFLLSLQKMYAQTTIPAGEVKGVWIKKGSPYLIKGDINIPEGDSLLILPGVKITFSGQYKINVQGSLKAIGTVKDSIIFTIADTSGKDNQDFRGWNGIHFDRRPIKWDTIKFRLPNNEEARKAILERINKEKMDTSQRIILSLLCDDLVKDTLIKDSIFNIMQSSRLNFCRFEFCTSGFIRPYMFGGAIYIYRYSNLVISNCLFKNNKAYAGGAIYCKEAAPVITNNTISNCYTESSGGAMVFIHSGPFIFNNIIKENRSGYNGGGLLFYESCPYVLNNTIICNKAINIGGGIYCEKEHTQFITTGKYMATEKIKYDRDTAIEKGVIDKHILGSANNPYGRFVNNVICNNEAKQAGAIGLSSTAPEFVNNTVSNNIAAERAGAIFCYFSAPSFVNSIIYDNSSNKGNNQIYLYGNSNLSISYCDVESGPSGIEQDTSCKSAFVYSNNINVVPMFNNPSGYDYSLKDKSKCINAGMPDISSLNLALIDITGKDRVIDQLIDLGALEYTRVSLSKAKSTEDEISDVGFPKEFIIAVYPNPSYGKFYVTMHNNPYPAVIISVFTPKGQLLYNTEYNTDGWVEEQIDLSDVTSGIYIIMIHSGSNVLYKGEVIVE